MSDYVLLKVIIYNVVKNKTVCVYVVCWLYVVDIHPVMTTKNCRNKSITMIHKLLNVSVRRLSV